MDGFGCSKSCERYAQRVQRLVITTHADPFSYQVQSRNSKQPNQYSGARPEDEKTESEFGQTYTGRRRTGN